MNIAFVTIGFAPLRTAGIDIIGERLIMGVLAENHHVTVIAGQREDLPEVFDDPRLEIVRLPLGPTNWIGFGLRAAIVLRALARQKNFDIIHFFDIYFAWAYYGEFLGSLHHSFYQRLTNSGNVGFFKKMYYLASMLLAERPAAKRSVGLLAVSETSMQEYLRKYPINPSKVVMTRNGIDTQFFQPVPNTESLRTALNIPLNDPVIMYSGFFTPRKGLKYLAQAMQEIKPAPWLVLTGSWDDAFRNKFHDQLGPTCSRFVEAGFVPDELMPAYFSMADLYVSSSLLEGFGLPLGESLACETPVVCANAGAVAEVVGPGGVLVPPGDPHTLAQAVSALLVDSEERQKLGQRGRLHIIQNFSIETMIQAYLDVYRKFQ